MTNRFSNKLTNLSWLCALLVVLIHAGTYAANLPGAALQTIYGKNWATFLQLFFTEGICRAAVPLFFLMSGYLFYRSYEPTARWHKNKILKRLRTNGIPYLFWGLAVIAFFAVAQAIPAVKQYFSSADRQIAQFSLSQWLNTIFLSPINSPLWFLRDLIVLALVSPLLSLLCKKVPWVWLPLVAVWWMLGLPIYVIRIESLLFFSCGAFLSLYAKDKLESFSTPKWLGIGLLTVWLVFISCKVFHLIGLDSGVLIHGDYNLLHDVFSKINAVFGAAVLWLAYDFVDKTGKTVLPFARYSFLMFVMHHPLISVMKKLLMKLLAVSYLSSVIAFFTSFALTVMIVVLIGTILRKLLPRFYAFITGGR